MKEEARLSFFFLYVAFIDNNMKYFNNKDSRRNFKLDRAFRFNLLEVVYYFKAL